MKDFIPPELSDEELELVSGKVFVTGIKDIIYVLYTDRMEMYFDHFDEKFNLNKSFSLPEMLQYCHLHDIKVLPVLLKKKSRLKYFIEYKRTELFGCAIKDAKLADIIHRFLIVLLFDQEMGDKDGQQPKLI